MFLTSDIILTNLFLTHNSFNLLNILILILVFVNSFFHSTLAQWVLQTLKRQKKQRDGRPGFKVYERLHPLFRASNEDYNLQVTGENAPLTTTQATLHTSIWSPEPDNHLDS